MVSTLRRKTRRRRRSLFIALERLSDDQVLLCRCDEQHTACAG